MRIISVDSDVFVQVLMLMVWQFGRALAHKKAPGLGPWEFYFPASS